MKKVINAFILLLTIIVTAGCVELIPYTELDVVNKYPSREKDCELINHGNWNEAEFKEEKMLPVALFTSGSINLEGNEKKISETGCEAGGDGYYVMKTWVSGPKMYKTVYFVKHRVKDGK